MTLRKILWASACILAMSLSCLAQGSRLMSGAGEGNNYHFFFETVVEPGEPQIEQIGGGIMTGPQLHRIMLDARNRAYFGYDVTIEALPERDMYRISFGPLTASREDLRFLDEEAPRYTQLPAPSWRGPAVRTIHAGDVLALDLLTNSATGQKIVDYVTVQRTAEPPAKLGPLPRNFIQERGEARDFRAADAWMDIQPDSMNLDGNTTRTGGVSGSLPYFYFPQYGRFVLSLTPQPELGFRKAGEIRGSSLSFDINGHNVSLVSAGRIAPGAGPFNLYVLHEPDWVGRGGKVAFAVGVANPKELIRSK